MMILVRLVHDVRTDMLADGREDFLFNHCMDLVSGPPTCCEQEPTRRDVESGANVQPVNQSAEFLARLEEGNSLRWHFDLGSRSWIASDAPSSLARVEASESADLNLVPGSQGTYDAFKYGTNDDVGFLQGNLNGSV